MPTILTDEHMTGPALMPLAIGAVEDALRQRAAGLLVAPPRHNVGFGDLGALVFTIGGTAGADARVGFRVYGTFNGPHDTQIVAVWSPRTSKLEGLVVGERLGPIRTGAIGAVAVKYLSREDARIMGILGSAMQARTQLEAIATVRRIDKAYVFSRDPEKRRSFAKIMSERLGIEIEATETARAAVEQADIVVVATNSAVPVFEAGWLKPGCHVNTLGPKTTDGSELDPAVARIASAIFTDSIDQTKAYKAPFFLDGTPDAERMKELTDIFAATAPGRRRSDDITLFCSVGLAGTEVLVASRIIDSMRPPT